MTQNLTPQMAKDIVGFSSSFARNNSVIVEDYTKDHPGMAMVPLSTLAKILDPTKGQLSKDILEAAGFQFPHIKDDPELANKATKMVDYLRSIGPFSTLLFTMNDELMMDAVNCPDRGCFYEIKEDKVATAVFNLEQMNNLASQSIDSGRKL